MALTTISNVDLWEAVRAKYPQFKAHTPEGTAEVFTERGYTALTSINPGIMSEFFELTMRVYLQKVRAELTSDPLTDSGFGEYYETPWGGYNQRMYVYSMKPVSPGYLNLKDGDSPDPFVVRKPKLEELFFAKNFNYQSLMTIPDAFAFKQIFVQQNGFSEVMSGFMTGLENGYRTQKYLNILETLNAGMNSTDYPLQDSQKVPVYMNKDITAATTDQLTTFILKLLATVEIMQTPTQMGGFNQMGFTSTQERGRLKLLIRQGYKSALAVRTLTGAFNPEQLGIDIDVIEVPHFGGMEPYKEAALTTPLYPVYQEAGNIGDVIGWAETEGATTPTVALGSEFYKDPNEDTFAVLADKGIVFTSMTNAYEVETIRNPRGKYTNYWANSPDNAINYDHSYNLVKFIYGTDNDADTVSNVNITGQPIQVETVTTP